MLGGGSLLGRGGLLPRRGAGARRAAATTAERLAKSLPHRVVLVGDRRVARGELGPLNALEDGVEGVPRHRQGKVGAECLASAHVDGDGACGIAGPHGERVLRGVAAEPQVAGVGGGARLAGDGLVDGEARGGARGAAVGDNALEDLGQRLGHARVEHLLGSVLVLVDNLAVAVLDLGDGHGLAVIAARGKGRVGLGHVEGRDGGRTEGERGGRIHLGGNAEVAAGVDHVLHAHGVGHLHVAGVGRVLGRASERDGAVALIAVVLHLVGLVGAVVKVHGRAAVDADLGVHALLERRGERKRLKGGAHLAPGGGVVGVLVVGVVVAATHHGADVARAVLEHGHAGVEAVEVPTVELLHHRRLGSRLDGGVDRGVDGEAAREDGVVVKLLREERAHVVHEVGLAVDLDARGGVLGHVEDELLGLRGVVLLLGDLAVGEHAVEDGVAALEGKIGVDGGVVARGRIGQAHQKRCLGKREVEGVLGEVRLGRCLDAVGAVAVVDGVEVHHENLFFGVDLLHLEGEVGLADLALERVVKLLVGEDGVAYELLGDGRGALVAAGELHRHGAHDAHEVDTVVLVEALVLGGHGAVEHVGRDLVDGDGLAVLSVEARDLVTLRVEHGGGLAREVEVGVGVVGQVLEPAAHVAEHADTKGDAGNQQKPNKRPHDGGNEMRLGSPHVALAWTHRDLLKRLRRAPSGRDMPQVGNVHMSYHNSASRLRGCLHLAYAGIFQTDAIPG